MIPALLHYQPLKGTGRNCDDDRINYEFSCFGCERPCMCVSAEPKITYLIKVEKPITSDHFSE